MHKKNIQDIYPLTPMQQGMLFHSMYTPDAGLYVEQLIHDLEVSPTFNLDLFIKAWQNVVNRHAILRTGFVSQNKEKPLQIVFKQVELPVQIYDWRHLSREGQAIKLAEFIDEDRILNFNLAKAPLTRLAFIQLSDEHYSFIWTYHHLLLDAWAARLVYADVVTFYNALMNNISVTLPDPPSYRSYISWLQKQDLHEASEFWENRLQGIEQASTFIEEEYVYEDINHYIEYEYYLPEVLTQAIETFSRQYHLTINTLLQAAWALVLSRWTGRLDVIFGVTVSGRSASVAQAESIVGLFINTLPLTTTIPEHTSILKWLLDLQEEQFTTRKFEYCALTDIHKWSDIPANKPLFTSILVSENVPGDSELQNLVPFHVKSVKYLSRNNYPLTIAIEKGERLFFQITYSSPPFKQSMIERLVACYQYVLEHILRNPQSLIKDMRIVPDQTHVDLLEMSKGAVTELPACSVAELFSKQVRKNPHQLAIVEREITLSYQELDHLSNKLARLLEYRGVMVGDNIGLMFNRSPQLIVCMLAILKLGATYVPLDPAYPRQRLESIIDSSTMKLLISDTVPSDLSSYRHILIYDQHLLQNYSNEPYQRIYPLVIPAYIIYTSGSTGKPKGVKISQKALVHYVQSAQQTFEIMPEYRVLQFASINFDTSVEEIWCTLLHGATLVLRTDECIATIPDFLEFCELYQINVLDLPTAFWHELTQQIYDYTLVLPPSIKVVIIGGEAAQRDKFQLWRQYTDPRIKLINSYGPTEVTVAATLWSSTSNQQTSDSRVPIGTPISNVQTYVVDKQGRLTLPGVPGELYIGGAGLANNYDKLPGLTAERFIPHPWSGIPGSRLYRTGDIVRWNGKILEYLGRTDEQVKIRGFRVELDEIQYMIGTHQYVQKSTVLSFDDTFGQKQLVAYIVPRNKKPLNALDIKNFLKQKLPYYMIPGSIFFLDDLPVSPNGKIDKHSLPKPDFESHSELKTVVNPIESLIIETWRSVLNVEHVTIHTNFFEAGGHSLIATQLIARLRKVLDKDVPLRAVFEYPTVSEFLKYVKLDSKNAYPLPLIVPQPETVKAPLSASQHQLWLIEQLSGDHSPYHMMMGFKCIGTLQVDVLQKAFQALVERHSILRTTYDVSKPVQIIHQASFVKLNTHDLSALGLEEAYREVYKAIQTFVAQPQDIYNLPVLYIHIYQVAANESVLLITLHHIAADGWSQVIFEHEIRESYTAYLQNISVDLPELEFQYSDYAHWQNDLLENNMLSSQLHYWMEYLKDAPSFLNLPTDFNRPAIQTFNGAVNIYTIDQPVSVKIQDFAKEHYVTPFIVLLSTFNLLLWSYTDQKDLLVGIPVSHRPNPEMEKLIGFFVNTMVVRTKIHPQVTFIDVLNDVRNSIINGHANNDVPFEYIIEHLDIRRDISRNPLFQVMFLLNHTSDTGLQLPDLEIIALDIQSNSSKFELTLAVEELNQEYRCNWEYNTDLFSHETIENFHRMFITLLEQVLNTPTLTLNKLSLITESEYKILNSWNDTAIDFVHKNIMKLINEQVIKTPDNIAVVDSQAHLSYAELQLRALRLAQELKKKGVSLETRVGVALPRSTALVIALLGIWYAGGAYVPLDPALPKKRIDYMIHDANISLTITDSFYGSKILYDYDVLLLDGNWLYEESFYTPNNVTLYPNNLAYIIYTSGSTGFPKGAMITHHGLTNYLLWSIDAYKVAQGIGSPVHSSISFDLTVTSLFTPLITGKTVYMLADSMGVESLIEALGSNSQYSLVKITPAHLKLLQHRLSIDEIKDQVYTYVIGGEQLLPHQIELWRNHAPNTMLVNEYGPTETVVGCCVHIITSADVGSSSLPIGKPIANTQLYILNESLQHVPIGAMGELFIGGAGVARGYLNRPGLTAERFLPDPFSGKQGSCMYKTGDLVYWRSDGVIEYVDRCDNQVKIRGYRIELGEVESILSSLPFIKEAVVVTLKQESEDILVGYIIPDSEYQSDISEVKEQMKNIVPAYMIPSQFVILDSFPLTSNGKVDRKRLPQPVIESEAEVSFDTELENSIAEIWHKFLPHVSIHPNVNFFTSGGHSLSAARMIASVKSLLDIELPLRSVFEQPVFKDFIFYVQHNYHKQYMPPLVVYSDVNKAPVSFQQQRLWVLYQLESQSSAYVIPAALRIKGSLDKSIIEQAIEHLVARHQVLRTVFDIENDVPIQVIMPDLKIEVHNYCMQNQDNVETKVLDWIKMHVNRPFDLQKGPLARFIIAELSDTETILAMAIHHIISDGISLGIMLQDLFKFYEAGVRNEPALLNSVDINYTDFAYWQREWLSDIYRQSLRKQWRELIDGTDFVLNIPTDFPRPAIQKFDGCVESVLIPSELVSKVQAWSDNHNVTLFMTLLSVWGIILQHYTQQKDFIIGIPSSQRPHPELENVAGFFVNTLPIRIKLDESLSVVQFVQQTKQQLIASMDIQALPFEEIVDELQPVRDLSVSPVFQTFFALLNSSLPSMKIADLQIDPLDIDWNTSQFDISWYLEFVDGKIVGKIEYCTQLLKKPTIQRIKNYYLDVLNQLVSVPQVAVRDIKLLSEKEIEIYIKSWNNTQLDIPEEPFIIAFARQTDIQPLAIAVKDVANSYTYKEVNESANRLAFYLLEKGISHGDRVGIYIERNVNLLVALLAVQKIGAAYIPLDPYYPYERIKWMIDSSGMQSIITSSLLVEYLQSENCELISLDSQEIIDSLQTYPSYNPPWIGSIDQIAYIIYTSGSTGRPKGVAISQRSMLNFLWSMSSKPGLEATDRCIAITTISFDIAVLELYLPLFVGASVVIVSRDVVMDGSRLLETITSEKINVMQATPTTWRLLIDAGWTESACLEKALVGGEALPYDLAEALTSRCQYVWNMYGPTETTVWSAVEHVSLSNVPQVKIGRPIFNTQVYILNDLLQPVPIGVHGNIYISGSGVAQAYINNPRLTAERFIPDPFSSTPGKRMYFTGDIGCYDEQGVLQCFGRSDHQVKVRGFRIELGEIESVLLLHSDIEEAVVVVSKQQPSEQLVAYVRMTAGISLNVQSVRLYLAEILPDYMIPAIYVTLESFPLTANGKIDRNSLAHQAFDVIRSDIKWEAPRTPVEEGLLAIWQRILQLDSISIHDDFFALGGNSVLATSMLILVRSRFEINIPLRNIFLTPTIAELSEQIQVLRSLATTGYDDVNMETDEEFEMGEI